MKKSSDEIKKVENSQPTVERFLKRRIPDVTPFRNAVRYKDHANKPIEISHDLKENKKMRKCSGVFENACNTQVAIEGIDNTSVDETEVIIRAQKKKNKIYEEGIAKTVVGLCKGMKENVFTYMLQATNTSTPLSYLFKLKKLVEPLRKLNNAVEEIRNLNIGSSNDGVQPSPLEHIPNLQTLMEHLIKQRITNVTEDMVKKHINTKVLQQHYNLYRTERLKTLSQVENAIQAFEIKLCEFRKYMEEAVESCNREIKYIKKERSSPLLTAPLKRSACGLAGSCNACCCCNKIGNDESSSLSSESSEGSEPKAKVNPRTSSDFLQYDSSFKTALPVNDLYKSAESYMKFTRLFKDKKQEDENLRYFTNALKRIVKVEGVIDNINQGVETYKSIDGTKLIILFWKSPNLSETCDSREISQIYVLKGFRTEDSEEEIYPQVLGKEQDQVVPELQKDLKNPKNDWNPRNRKNDCDTQNLDSNFAPMIMKTKCDDRKICEQNSTKVNSEPQNPKDNRQPQSPKDIRKSQSPRSKLKPQSPKDNRQPPSPKDIRKSHSPRSKFKPQSARNNSGLQCRSDNHDEKILSKNIGLQSPSQKNEQQSKSENRELYNPLEGCSHYYSDIKLESSTSSTKQVEGDLKSTENRWDHFETDQKHSVNVHEVPMEFKVPLESYKPIGDKHDSKEKLYKLMDKENKKPVKCKKRSTPGVTISERLIALEEFNDCLLYSACALREHYLTVEPAYDMMVSFCKKYIKSERGPGLLLNEFLQKPIPNLFRGS